MKPTRADIVWSYLDPAEILHLADGTWTADDLRREVWPSRRGSVGNWDLNFETIDAGCSWCDGHYLTPAATARGLLTWAQMQAAVRDGATPALVAALADVHEQVAACGPDMHWHPGTLAELADTVRAARRDRAVARYYRLQPALRRAAAAIVFAPVQLDLLAAS